nr:LysR family transcriptional regulator [Pelistega indica]
MLFEKSRRSGFTLTQAGMDLLAYAEKMESHLLNAMEKVSNMGSSLSGNLKIAATEGFGSYVLTPIAMQFQALYPSITLDVMPFQRFVSHSKRETDIVISIERPARGPYIGSKIADYSLKLYATKEYLEQAPPLRKQSDFAQHRFIAYIDELIISDQLRYIDDIIPLNNIIFRSNSVVAQMRACLQGKALAVLPCFMAESQPLLESVLEDSFTITRSFWMHYHEDLKNLRRIEVFTQYMKQQMAYNERFMLGKSKQLKIKK